MGYESKLYIVEKGTLWSGEEKRYAQVIAKYDMCKCYFLSDVLTRGPKTNCYFYADDGNTPVLTDMYDDPLRESSIQTVIDVLEEAVENGEEYRRIFPLLAMLKVFEEQRKQGHWGDIVVLHYGY